MSGGLDSTVSSAEDSVTCNPERWTGVLEGFFLANGLKQCGQQVNLLKPLESTFEQTQLIVNLGPLEYFSDELLNNTL